MKPIYTIAFLLSFGLVIMAQQQGNRMGTSLPDENTNLPVQKVGVDDLLGISVYDAPELTRSVRVDTQGMIRLPLLKHQVKAAGLLPSEVEAALVGVLKNEDILVNPI